MKLNIYFPIIFILVICLFQCDIYHGLAPLPGKLTVKVTFRGEPPPNTEGIYLIVMPQFPPQAINQLYHSSNSLPINQDTVYTEIPLPYGHYEAYSLWWYSLETESNLADVLALKTVTDENLDLIPDFFDITPENPVVEKSLPANWNWVTRNSVIEGTIHFSGLFPENTMAMAIAAYTYEPKEDIDYLRFLKAIDFGVGPESRNYDSKKMTYTYRLPLRHGEVKYLAIFWLPERADLTDFVTIGFYQDSLNPNIPGILTIPPDTTLSNIDVYADWSNIE